jgi:RNA polymerase sigma-70 factor (ECF subfamily)
VRSDEQLIAVYRDSGQREALDELTERHLGRVRAMIYTMVLDKSLADDLTQEVFLRAFRGLASFDGRSRFSTWLYRVTMNTIRGFLARHRRSPVSFRAKLPDGCHLSSEHPEAVAMQSELESAVEAALRDLPPKLRAAMVLITLQRMDVGEAARIEGCTRATMYWRLHEARKRLKRRLKGHLAP